MRRRLYYLAFSLVIEAFRANRNNLKSCIFTGSAKIRFIHYWQAKLFVMKYGFAILLLMSASLVMAQPTVTEQFQKITTVDQAKQYIEANPNLKPTLLQLSYGKDTTLI